MAPIWAMMTNTPAAFCAAGFFVPVAQVHFSHNRSDDFPDVE